MPSQLITNLQHLSQQSAFAQALTQWYQATGRDLPWRHTKDPYAIWVSEIMLQQTQVATVIPYYRRFLAAFPTIAALAAAAEADVLKHWEGLGYYSRCRNLQKAARHLVDHHQGEFPTAVAEVEALPGIGRSTAGAILTFAFGQRHPLLDGNVKRVLARLFDVDDSITAPAVVRQLWAHSHALLQASDDPYAFNQGIMELGATCCTPKQPQCLVCPVAGFCAAKANGTQLFRPVKPKAKTTPHHHIGVAVLQNQTGAFYIQQRPATGLLGGLWEFPGGKQEPGETLTQTVVRELQEELGVTVRVDAPLVQVKHAYSHFKVTLHVFHCTVLQGTPVPSAADAMAWVPLDQLRQYPFPKANHAIIAALEQQAASTNNSPVE